MIGRAAAKAPAEETSLEAVMKGLLSAGAPNASEGQLTEGARVLAETARSAGETDSAAEAHVIANHGAGRLRKIFG